MGYIAESIFVIMKGAKAAISRVKTLTVKLANLSFIYFLSYYSYSVGDS